MNKELKKHIRILAKKFNHNIEFQKDAMILSSKINKIKLWTEDKNGTNISYNLGENQSEELKIATENVYDIVIELFSRKEINEIVEIKAGILLTVEEWINEEGQFAKAQFEKIKRDSQHTQIESRKLGGNRYEAEYYNGVLILTDDLCWAKSNVISI